jgi:membrane protein involved in colicin uptake
MSNEQVQYEKPDSRVMLAAASQSFEIANDIVVDTPAMYELAADQLGEIKAAIKSFTERRLGITRKLDDLKKDVTSLFTPALTKLEEAKSLIETRMLQYNDKQRKLQQEEQRRLDAIAAEEKRRLEEEARKVREEAERLAKAAKTKAQKEAAQTAQLEAAEAAEALQQTAAVVVAATSAVQAPKAVGTSTRVQWKGRCDNKLEAIRFVAEHPEYQDLFDINTTTLNALARSQKANMKVGGCVAFEDRGITTRVSHG